MWAVLLLDGVKRSSVTSCGPHFLCHRQPSPSDCTIHPNRISADDIEALEGSRCRLGFALCGYVLMPDHWHALIWPRPPLTISQVLHDVKKTSARKLHRWRGTAGPLWQHQFWDRFVRDAKEFNERLEYMHLNPPRKGLVSRPEEWRWSSYNNFALEKATVRRCPIQIDYVRLPEQYRG